MKKILIFIMIIALTLSGCAVPFFQDTDKTTITTTGPDGTVTVEERDVSKNPETVSKEAAQIVEACFKSFEAREEKQAKQMETMESDHKAITLVAFKGFDSILMMQGFTAANVCKSPTNIYDYAKVHDAELYGMITSVGKAVMSQVPVLAMAYIAAQGIDNAGDNVGGDKNTYGRDGTVVGDDYNNNSSQYNNDIDTTSVVNDGSANTDNNIGDTAGDTTTYPDDTGDY